MANAKSVSYFLASVLFVLTSSLACSVQEKSEGDNKKVQIETPFGDMKVNTSAEAKDVGIKVYPGATPRKPNGDDSHSANVQLGNHRFGLKLVAAEYESPDAPEKVLEFYRKELKSFGSVVECKNTSGEERLESFDADDDKSLECDNKGGPGDGVELKVGTPDRQRIVAVHPNGSGSRFALVYIQKRGKEMM